jgi:hypothetical protein
MLSQIMIVIARSDSDEAIQAFARPLDCFPSLAMTMKLVRSKNHPAPARAWEKWTPVSR